MQRNARASGSRDRGQVVPGEGQRSFDVPDDLPAIEDVLDAQIATSAVEDLAVLLGKGGGENEKLIFKILKRGDKLEEARAGGELADMGLRFDLTLPLARYYSKYGSTLRPMPTTRSLSSWTSTASS